MQEIKLYSKDSDELSVNISKTRIEVQLVSLFDLTTNEYDVIDLSFNNRIFIEGLQELISTGSGSIVEGNHCLILEKNELGNFDFVFQVLNLGKSYYLKNISFDETLLMELIDLLD